MSVEMLENTCFIFAHISRDLKMPDIWLKRRKWFWIADINEKKREIYASWKIRIMMSQDPSGSDTTIKLKYENHHG